MNPLMNPQHANLYLKRPRSPVNSFAAFVLAAVAGSLICTPAHSQFSLSPLSSFGSNGWVAPGTSQYVTTGNFERGMGWNPVTKNLVLPSRSGGNFVAIIDGTSGAVVKTMDTTGVAGGLLTMMGAGVSDDGAIYVPNLQSGSNSVSPFKIYKWTGENDTNAPTVAFSQVNPQVVSGAFRFGDSFDVYGSGTNARFAAAGSSTGTNAATGTNLPNNGNFMIGALDGSNVNTIYSAIPGTATTANDYRLSLTFVDADTIIGNATGSAKITDFVAAPTLSGTGATLSSAITISSQDRAIGYTFLGGRSLLAALNSANSMVSIYDITDPAAFQLLVSNTTVSGSLTGNANGTGGVQWGEAIDSTSQVIYAMNSNQGIQAMVFTIPEPSTYALLGIGALGLLLVLRKKKSA